MERVSVQQLQTILRDAKEIQDSRDFTDLVAAYALQHGFSSSSDFIHFVTPLTPLSPQYDSDLLGRLSGDENSTSECLQFLADGDEGGFFYVLSESYDSRLKYTSGFLRWRVVDPAGVSLYEVDNCADWDHRSKQIVFGDKVELHRGNWLCLRVRKSSISLLSLPVCVARWILVPPEYGSIHQSTRGESTSLLRQNAVYRFLRWSDAFWRPNRERAKFRGSGAPLLVQLQRLVRTWLRKRTSAATPPPPAPTATPQQQPVAFADALQLTISRENEQAAAKRAVFLGRSKLNFLHKLPEELTLKILGYVDVIELLTNFGQASRGCRALLFGAMQNKGAPAELQNLYDRFRLVLFCKRVAQLPRRGRKLDFLSPMAADTGRATDTETEAGGTLAGYSSVVPRSNSSRPGDWIDSLLASPLAGLRSMLVQALSQLWSDAKGEISLRRNPPEDSPPRYTQRGRFEGRRALQFEEPFPRSSDAPESEGLRYGLQLQLGGSNSRSIQPARASYYHRPTYDLYQLRLRLEVLPYDCARAFCLEFDCFYRRDAENVWNFPDADVNSDGRGNAVPPWISSIVEVQSQRQVMSTAGFLVCTDDVDYLTNSSRYDVIHARQAAAEQRFNDLMMRNFEDSEDEDEDREENGDGEDDVDGTDGDGGIHPADRFIFTGHGLSQYTNLQLG